jgi:hypothetical protein
MSIVSAVFHTVQSTNVTDMQTDRHLGRDKAGAYIAWRGKIVITDIVMHLIGSRTGFIYSVGENLVF